MQGRAGGLLTKWPHSHWAEPNNTGMSNNYAFTLKTGLGDKQAFISSNPELLGFLSSSNVCKKSFRFYIVYSILQLIIILTTGILSIIVNSVIVYRHIVFILPCIENTPIGIKLRISRRIFDPNQKKFQILNHLSRRDRISK